METPSKGGRELALPLTKGLLNSLAAILGLVIPGPAAAVLAGGAEAVEFAHAFLERRRGRERERLEHLVDNIERRLVTVERQLSEPEIDLFLEVTRKAVEDDEPRKVPVYSAILAWLLEKKPTSAQVRVLSDAVRTLSYVEIWALLSEMNGGRAKEALESCGLDESIYLKRVEAVGLTQGGVRFNGSGTPLAHVLKRYVSLQDIAVP